MKSIQQWIECEEWRREETRLWACTTGWREMSMVRVQEEKGLSRKTRSSVLAMLSFRPWLASQANMSYKQLEMQDSMVGERSTVEKHSIRHQRRDSDPKAINSPCLIPYNTWKGTLWPKTNLYFWAPPGGYRVSPSSCLTAYIIHSWWVDSQF